MKASLRILLALALVAFVASCASTKFSEQSSMRTDEITAFGEIVLNSEVALDDLTNLGLVEMKRTVTYTLEMNGDYTIEMGDYSFSYTALDGSTVETGTRVVGNLNYSALVGTASSLVSGAVDTGLLGGVLGGMLGSGAAEPASTSAANLGPRQIALDAVNYDMLQAAAKKGGMALLLPEYSWEIEEKLTGTDTAGLLFLPPSRVYETKELLYTVTARAVVVSF